MCSACSSSHFFPSLLKKLNIFFCRVTEPVSLVKLNVINMNPIICVYYVTEERNTQTLKLCWDMLSWKENTLHKTNKPLKIGDQRPKKECESKRKAFVDGRTDNFIIQRDDGMRQNLRRRGRSYSDSNENQNIPARILRAIALRKGRRIHKPLCSFPVTS